MRRAFLTGVLLLSTLLAGAQVPLDDSGYSLTMISPQYFGPYAFPVPDCNQGKLCSDFRVDLSCDYVRGNLGGGVDHTCAATFLLSAPLWTDRVTLSLFGEFHEWYWNSPESFRMRRISPKYPMNGHDGGNVYVCLDILALREKKYVPSIAFRAIFLTATGDDYETARHYDAPGYAFDLTVGKDFGLSRTSEHVLRPYAGIGFVCWQVDRGSQNDALLLEAGLCYRNKWLSLDATYGQYSGRIGVYSPGEGDRPKTVKVRAGFSFGMFTPFLYFQQGLEDWPFTQLRAGLRVDIPAKGLKKGE